MTTQTRKIALNASVVAGGTLLSRILGFLRDVIIAFALGAGPWADAFFVAFRIPNLLRRLTAEGSLTMAFVPVFTRIQKEQGQEKAYIFTRSALVWLIGILGVVSLIAIFGASYLIRIVAPGFADDPQVFEHTVFLVRICFPYIIFISAVALCMGFLNARDHFLAPALAPCVLNISLIAASLLAVWLEFEVSVALSIGVLVAGLGQWLLQQPFLSQQGFTWRGKWSLKDKGVRRAGKLMLPTVAGAAVYQLNVVMITVLASFLAQGSISYLYYADRLVQFPLGVFGIAVSTAALPSLSSLAASAKMEEFVKTLNSTLGLILFISLPAMAGLIALREPLVEVLFARGAFEGQSVQETAWALVGYSLGLPAFCSVRSLVSAFYAQEDTRSPVLAAAICMLLNVALGLILMQYLRHVGLALAVALSSWLNIFLLGIFLRRHVGAWFSWSRSLLFMLLLSAALGYGVWLTASWDIWALLCIPLWIIFYWAAAYLLSLEEARMFLRVMQRVTKRFSIAK
jgi:putative peptidoglycan lipid II flippase